MNSPFPYHLTDQSLTFYVEGLPCQVLRDHPNWSEIIEAVQCGDPSAVELSKPISKIREALIDLTPTTESERWFRRTAGEIEVTEWGVTLNGQALHGHVIDRLMDVMSTGLSITPWVNFVRKLYQNPSSTARNELYLWLEKSGMPITADGDFLAYKRVRDNYKDIYSNTFDNSVGSTVEMARLDVDDDRNRTCSAGLHFCSKDYLPHFSAMGNSDRVVIVKINPADVVSIPSDYNDAKGRTWRYVVIGEMSLTEAGLHLWEAVDTEWSEDWLDDEYDDLWADEFGDEDEDDIEDDLSLDVPLPGL